MYAAVADSTLEGSETSYKQAYKEAVEEQLSKSDQFSRVHTEVSVKQGNRFDVVVFGSELSRPIQWVRSGSKRFAEGDLEAVFELKFVKNKTFFPLEWSIRSDAILDARDAELRDQLDKSENKILGDLTELNALPTTVETYFLLFSNNNYLLEGELTEPEHEEEKKIRVGRVAKEWLVEEASGTAVLYGHPFGHSWLNDPS